MAVKLTIEELDTFESTNPIPDVPWACMLLC